MRHPVVALALAFASMFPGSGVAAGKHHYVFSYFKGNGADGVYLAYSDDGLRWRTLNGDRPVLTPEAGRARIVRDPMILHGPDGRFHMVWTVGWGLATPQGIDREPGIGYASSPDLVHWSDQRYLPVMAQEERARNAWAPEIVYDEAAREYLIFWSTTVPGKFPDTDGQLRKGRTWDPGWDHRIYFVTTRDFRTLTAPQILYNGGFNVIDATMVRDGKRFLLFVKDETDQPHTPQKRIRVATAPSPRGPWSAASPPITGSYWAEGPSVLNIDGLWHVYFDKYMEGKYGLVTSRDLQHWEEASDRLSMPAGVRHGSALEISSDVADVLLASSSAK